MGGKSVTLGKRTDTSGGPIGQVDLNSGFTVLAQPRLYGIQIFNEQDDRANRDAKLLRGRLHTSQISAAVSLIGVSDVSTVPSLFPSVIMC